MAITGDYVSQYTGEEVDARLALAGTSLQQGLIKQTTGTSTTDIMSQNAISTNLYTLSGQIDDLIDGTTTIDKATNADLAIYAYGANFDVIISTQAEFETLIASPTWLGAKSVLFNGKNGAFTLSTADNGGIKIPSTVKQIQGLNDATITITNFLYNATTDNAGFWYDALPTTNDYFIRDITFNVTSIASSGSKGLLQCINVENCIINVTSPTQYNSIGVSYCNNVNNCVLNVIGSSTNSVAFSHCNNISNCTYSCENLISGSIFGFSNCNYINACNGDMIGALSGSIYGFNVSTNIINCNIIAVGDGGVGEIFSTCKNIINVNASVTGTFTLLTGFDDSEKISNCEIVFNVNATIGCQGSATSSNISNCIADITNTASGIASYGFAGSSRLVNCKGKGVSNGGVGYGFFNCSYASCCTAIPFDSSTTAIWGGTITKRDDDSCQTT